MSGEVASLLWFSGVLAALGILFAAGLKLPVMLAVGGRLASRCLMTGAAFVVTLVANLALFRHDAHIDLTREKAFTPSAEASAIIKNLSEPVSVTYFYQDQSPGARALNTMLLQLQRQNANFDLRLVDADRNPALASSQGVRVYNSAILRSGERRVEVVTTDDREIALGLLRVLRRKDTFICFASGHGEYDIDNFEFHTHFEGTHSHSHDAQGLAVVQMEQHGLGRLRHALEKLGLVPRKITLASVPEVPQECAVFVEANPRTGYSPPEVRLIDEYLRGGGSALFLIEPDYVLADQLQAVLSTAGIAVRSGVIVDPVAHYFTDEQMIAVADYGAHPVTRGLALSFYPGARPLERLPAAGVQTVTLVSSSRGAYVIADRLDLERDNKGKPRNSFSLAIAADGNIDGRKQEQPFRLIVFGDADFASNSFFPYLSNADVVLASLSWLIREERAPAMKPPIEVLPTVALTNVQMRSIFLLTVVLLPGLLALTGGGAWWLRR